MAVGKQPMLLTIFGGTGDLTYRKLLPALYNLMATKTLPSDLKVFVVGRRDYTSESYGELIKPWIKEHARLPFSDNIFVALLKHIEYVKMNFTVKADYQLLQKVYEQYPNAQHLYYYAVAPEFFGTISKYLRDCECMLDSSTHQVLIEKPFGVDLESATRLDKELLEVFDRDSIYRIDHYLGKEMIQNIFTIRFQNMLFKQVFNKESIDYIAITASETVGVETRGGYYDQTGALKDMVQNHMFQILSMVLMDEPLENDIHSFFKHQSDIIKRLRFMDEQSIGEQVVLGQYDAGTIEGEPVVAYHDEPHIKVDSKTETYVGLKLFVDHPLFDQVPIYVQTGKRMDVRSTEVLVVLKPLNNQPPNVLTLRISPDEGVYFTINAKKPGNSQDVISVSMDFCQSCVYENRINTPEAYERLLFGAFNKDLTLFSNWAMVEASWAYIDHLLALIKKHDIKPLPYQAGSFGPDALKDFLPASYFDYRTIE